MSPKIVDDFDATVYGRFMDIVQVQMCLMPLEYQAFSSAHRTASASESYLSNKRQQQKSSQFISRSDPSDPSSLVYKPRKGDFIAVRTTDRSPIPYSVSIPARVIRGCGIADGEYTLTSFHDNGCMMEPTARHPGTSMDSDVDEGEDIKEKYPGFQSTDDFCPITTTAAEQLHCISFVGPKGSIVSDMKAAYPLQLSVRIDEGRKCIIFDCFEYKPKCLDFGDSDLTKYYPTIRAYERYNQAFRPEHIENDDDGYWDEDDDSYLDEKKAAKGGYSPLGSGLEKIMIFCGLAGDFAYSRCLRFRFPLDNIVGIRLQKSDVKSSSNIGSEDAGAVLVLEVSRPPPKDAFASRKVQSRWLKDNQFVLTKDWTPNSAASEATRIYLYGGLKELKQTAALIAIKCPTIAAMLSSNSCKTNTLGDGASVEYSTTPNFSVSENVAYGEYRVKHRMTFKDLSREDREMLDEDIRNSFCRTCEQVYFEGHTGFPCPGCGNGRNATKLGEPASESAFDGRVENALEVFETKCKRMDEEMRGTQLKRKILED